MAISNARWDTELAFELDGRTLKYLRTSRAMIKCQLFRLLQRNSGGAVVREPLAYCMLDLRAARQDAGVDPVAAAQWQVLDIF